MAASSSSAPFDWQELLADMQQEVIWVLEARARQKGTDWPVWHLALAMLRRTCRAEWQRPRSPHPLRRQATGRRAQARVRVLAGVLHDGHAALFEHVLQWQEPRNETWKKDDAQLIAFAMGYHGDPAVLARFEASRCARLDPMPVMAGLCEAGHNFEWFKAVIGANNIDFKTQATAYCASYGRLDWLKVARDMGHAWGEDTCRIAADRGHLHILVYLHEHGCPWRLWTSYCAARKGHLDVLRYALDHGCEYDVGVMSIAARGGHKDVLVYLHDERQMPWAPSITDGAASGGHLDLLRYLVARDCPWDVSAMHSAASGGYLPIILFLRAKGCDYDTHTCFGAARGGHLGVLKHLHASGCPWDSRCTAVAVVKRDMDMLRYLHQEGCPMDDAAWQLAVDTGQLEVVQWLHEQGLLIPGEAQYERLCTLAANHNHLQVLHYLLHRVRVTL